MNIFILAHTPIYFQFNYIKIHVQNLVKYSQLPKTMTSHKLNQHPQSQISIVIKKKDSQLIISRQNSFIQDDKTFCFYFPQVEEVYYFQLSQEKQKQTLNNFAKDILTKNNIFFKHKIDPCSPLKYYTFDEKQITQSSLLNFEQCSSVKVVFLNKIEIQIPVNKILLQIKVSGQKKQIVKVDANQKMRVGELLLLNKLGHYKFSSLRINGQIVRHYQTLQKLNLKSKSYQAYPLFPFQTFYLDMHEIYNYMIKQKINVQRLAQAYGSTDRQRQVLKLLQQRFPNSSFDKITQATIIYIDSEYYNFKQHQKYLYKYFNGKIQQIEEDKQSQTISLMVNTLEKLPEDQESKFVYMQQQIGDDFDLIQKNEIFRIQTFSPTTNSIKKLKLNSKKSYLIYEIEHLSARQTGRYSGQYNNFTHIILPYNQYLVLSERIQGKNTHITLIQIPTPKYQDHCLILWVTDNFKQARSFNSNKLLPEQIKFQLMLFKDFNLFSIWLEKYVSLTASRRFCIIYNKDNLEEGTNIIKLSQHYFGKDANILMYLNENSNNVQKFSDLTGAQTTTSLSLVHNFMIKALQQLQIIDPEKDYKYCRCQIS